MLGEFIGSRKVLARPVRQWWPWWAAGRLRFLALHGHVGPVFGSLQVAPFKGDRENESWVGRLWGRQKLNSVHGGLDDFGLEFLVSNSNKDCLLVLRRGALWGRQPRGLPSSSALSLSLPRLSQDF